MTTHTSPLIHGLLAEFDSPGELLRAAERTRAAGYVRIDAFSPFPIHGLDEAIGFKENKVAPIILAGGICGLLGGFGLQYWTQVIEYPMNIGGRPAYYWVAWIPPTFEMTILFAALAGTVGMLALNGLPQPYHPLFNAPRFALASRNRFFFCIEARDPKFDRDKVREFLLARHPREVVDVDR